MPIVTSQSNCNVKKMTIKLLHIYWSSSSSRNPFCCLLVLSELKMNVFSSKENNGLQASCCNSSNDSSIAITKKLSYTSFPVKLFRLVTEERYSSLWWDGCGSHFAVNVPKFELEILRSESIPEEDRFKTITFTSFIRQLNLYGFRKVSWLAWLSHKLNRFRLSIR